MDVGVYTDSLSDLSFERALDVAAAAGVRSIEIATGGQSRAPHLDVDELLQSRQRRARFAAAIASRGLRISALNCSAWPLHPTLASSHADLIEKTLRLAAELHVTKIVTMSGCPGDGDSATTINWIWYPWPQDAVDLARRHWDATVRFWSDRIRLAEQSGVERIAFELHPLHVVYNVPTLLDFRAEVGPLIGANLDPSHLFWQQMDPIRAIEALGRAVFHVHMKDVEINDDQVRLAGVLDNRSFRSPETRAWVFRTIGRGHTAAYWAQFVQALRRADYDDSLSIEQEDPYAGQEEGVREAAAVLSGLLPEAADSARIAASPRHRELE